MAVPKRQGSEAEDRAAEFLLSLGYSLVTRRYRTRLGEIDIVAMDGDILVFVEVKNRPEGVMPEMAIDDRKIHRLWIAAQQYLRDFALVERPFRFDVVAIEAQEIRHLRDVFID